MKRSESRTSQAGKNRESSGEVHDRMQGKSKTLIVTSSV